MDRHRAIRLSDLIAVLSLRQRGVRSRLVLRDNSLYHTLTRPTTLMRALTQRPLASIGWRRGRRSGGARHNSTGAAQ